METAVRELTVTEFEGLVERTIDRRLQVWLAQLMDAVIGLPDEQDAELQPAFAAALERSLEQARAGDIVELDTFREQIGR